VIEGDNVQRRNVNYEDWLKEFEKDKEFLGQSDQIATEALHTVRRYLCGDKKVCETGITYTGRVVVRFGVIGADGVTIHWMPWETKHEIKVSKPK
jgi:hypothetical protein